MMRWPAVQWRWRGLLAAGVAILAGFSRPAAAVDVLVVSQTAAELSIIDTASDAITHRITLDPTAAAVAVSLDGTEAYVTHPERRQLSVIDLGSRSVKAKWPVGQQPFAVAVDNRGGVWVADWSSDIVQRIHIATGAVMRTIAVGRSPSAIAFAPDGGLLYTVNRESDDVSVADPVTGEELRRIAVGRAPFAIAGTADGRQLFVANVQASSLSIIDASRNRDMARVGVGRMPYGIAIDDKTGRVLVTNQQSGSVSILAPDGSKVIATTPVGQYPEGIVIPPGSGKAYVANWFSDSVSVIDIVSGNELRRISCPTGPRMLAVRPKP